MQNTDFLPRYKNHLSVNIISIKILKEFFVILIIVNT